MLKEPKGITQKLHLLRKSGEHSSRLLKGFYLQGLEPAFHPFAGRQGKLCFTQLVLHHSSAVRLSQSRKQHQEAHGSGACGHTITPPNTHPFCHLAGYNPSVQLFLIRYHKPAHGKSLLCAWGTSSCKYQLLLTPPMSRQGEMAGQEGGITTPVKPT